MSPVLSRPVDKRVGGGAVRDKVAPPKEVRVGVVDDSSMVAMLGVGLPVAVSWGGGADRIAALPAATPALKPATGALRKANPAVAK